MSRLYDTVEPTVIDEDMLQKAVEEQGPKEEAGRIAKQEGIDFADVESLRLDFKNILNIDNLWCFTSLVKLQLDNNIIEKIEGLDQLVNLVWLDLSFNNIEVIEGLDKLTKLEDLTLFNNRISRIENMDTLNNVHVFSIGNNDIQELDNTIYLRRFRQLQTLNLSGNPICALEEYQSYITAHLPALEYLDYRLVDQSTKAAAREKYEISIQEIEHDEKQAQKKADDSALKSKEHELHKEAYVELLNGPYLFESLYAEDAEGQKLADMPGVDELMAIFKEKFTNICHQIFDYGLEKNTERQNEVKMFWECIEEAKSENKDIGMKKISEFMDYKKEEAIGLTHSLSEQGRIQLQRCHLQLWVELPHISEQKDLEDKIADYNTRVSILWDTLMGLELQLVDQLEDAIKEFERNLADMVATFLELVQGYISQCRDLENTHNEKLLEIAIITLEKVVKNELDEEIPDDLRELFVDKDTIINAVTSSHDVHLLKIDNREDDIVTRINQWMTSLMETIHETEEIQRNRARVSEVNNLIDHLREEIDNLDLAGANY